MNVLVIGATGGTGRHAVRLLLERGHRVTAFVRTPAKVTEKNENLCVVQGDARNREGLEQATKGQDAVLCAFGPRSLKQDELQEVLMRNLVEAMAKNRVKRIVNLSAWGAGDSDATAHPVFKLFRALLLRHVFRDKERGEVVLLGSDLDFVNVRPGSLVFSDESNPKSLPTECLKAKILCESHNQALSPLDGAARSYFQTVEEFVRALATGADSASNRLFLMNGNDVEYAMLKMLCGLKVSGAVRGLGARELDPRWPQILFGHLEWPPYWGLGQFRIGFNLDSEHAAVQMGVKFASWHLLCHASDDLPSPASSRFRYRPDLLVTQRDGLKCGILLSYSHPSPEGPGGGFVRLTIHGTRQR